MPWGQAPAMGCSSALYTATVPPTRGFLPGHGQEKTRLRKIFTSLDYSEGRNLEKP